MMKGPMWSLGLESALKSGTRLPTHFPAASFHQICLRAESHGLPLTSQEARLYITRRFIGHDQAQFGEITMPERSAVPRRLLLVPESGQLAQYRPLPQE